MKSSLHSSDILNKALLHKFFIFGVVSMIVIFSAQNIYITLTNYSSTNVSIYSILMTETFFLLDLIAMLSGLLTLYILFQNGERWIQFAYLPLLLHYAFIFTTTHSATPQWKTALPINGKSTITPSQKILLRFEFHRLNNRVQLWAYALDTPAQQLQHLARRPNYDLLIARRAARQTNIEIENNNQDDLFVACPALSNPNNDEHSSNDYFNDFSTDVEENEPHNSVQLILDGIENADKCYYFLQVNTENINSNVIKAQSKIPTLTMLWLSFRGIAFIFSVSIICACFQLFWKKIGYPVIWRQKLIRQRVVEAQRLEQKLRNCNSFFSMETALAASISGGGSTVGDELESYHNKCHFSAII